MVQRLTIACFWPSPRRGHDDRRLAQEGVFNRRSRGSSVGQRENCQSAKKRQSRSVPNLRFRKIPGTAPPHCPLSAIRTRRAYRPPSRPARARPGLPCVAFSADSSWKPPIIDETRARSAASSQRSTKRWASTGFRRRYESALEPFPVVRMPSRSDHSGVLLLPGAPRWLRRAAVPVDRMHDRKVIANTG